MIALATSVAWIVTVATILATTAIRDVHDARIERVEVVARWSAWAVGLWLGSLTVGVWLWVVWLSMGRPQLCLPS